MQSCMLVSKGRDISLSISAPIGAPIEYVNNILHVSDHVPPALRAIPAIHETNALREVLWQRVGKYLLKSTIALLYKFCKAITVYSYF